MALRRLRADGFTRSELGAHGLEELSTNLWLGCCQTCGVDFADPDSPAVVISADGPTVRASLHHSSCREPHWSSLPKVGSSPHLTTSTRWARVPFGGAAAGEYWPTVLVNPGLEEIELRDVDGRYSATTVDSYRAFGMKPAPLDLTTAASGLESWLTDEQLIVRSGRYFWTLPMEEGDEVFAELVTQYGAVVLGVSTALEPGRLVNPEPIKRVLRTGDIALGLARISDSRAPAIGTGGPVFAVDDSDATWLPSVVPYAGPTYDPHTGRFEMGTGMDGPHHWQLTTAPGRVENGLVAGPPETGKTNVLRMVLVEALCSGSLDVAAVDPLDRNGLAGIAAGADCQTATTIHGARHLLAEAAALVAARASGARPLTLAPDARGFLLVVDDALAVLTDPEVAALAGRVAVEGPAVGVGLVVSTTSVSPEDFGGRADLVLALGHVNGFTFSTALHDQLRRLREIRGA